MFVVFHFTVCSSFLILLLQTDLQPNNGGRINVRIMRRQPRPGPYLQIVLERNWREYGLSAYIKPLRTTLLRFAAHIPQRSIGIIYLNWQFDWLGM